MEKEIDINEAILEGDDGFQAIAHLDTVEDLMEIVHNSYALLKEYVRRIKNVKPWGSMHFLMECAMVKNEASECVVWAENEMMIHNVIFH